MPLDLKQLTKLDLYKNVYTFIARQKHEAAQIQGTEKGLLYAQHTEIFKIKSDRVTLGKKKC